MFRVSASFYYILNEGKRQKALNEVALTVLSCIKGVFVTAA